MKKLMIIALTVGLLLCLVACGGQDPNGTTNAPTTTKNIVEQLAGKYTLYHVKSETEELDYFKVRMNDYLAGMYFDLRADGTLAGNLLGSDLGEGATWKPDGLTNAEGDLIPIIIENGELKFELNDATFTMLKEGDSRLDEPLPNMFQYLYDHIVTNGTQDDRGHTVVVEEEEGDYGHKVTMTATGDGKIFWSYRNYDDSVMEMELVENAEFQTITMPYDTTRNTHMCTATIETATVSYWEFQLSSFAMEPEYPNADTIQDIMTSRVSIMMMTMHEYLQDTVDISITKLGFENFNT